MKGNLPQSLIGIITHLVLNLWSLLITLDKQKMPVRLVVTKVTNSCGIVWGKK